MRCSLLLVLAVALVLGFGSAPSWALVQRPASPVDVLASTEVVPVAKKSKGKKGKKGKKRKGNKNKKVVIHAKAKQGPPVFRRAIPNGGLIKMQPKRNLFDHTAAQQQVNVPGGWKKASKPILSQSTVDVMLAEARNKRQDEHWVARFKQNAFLYPNTMNEEGHNYLHFAAWNGYEKLVRYLLSQGVDSSIKTPYGLTAHDLALRRGHLNIVHLLAR